MTEFTGNSLPPVVQATLNMKAVESGLDRLLSQLLKSYRMIGNTLRDGGYSSEAIGTQNSFGDAQLDVDVKTDAGICVAMACIQYYTHTNYDIIFYRICLVTLVSDYGKFAGKRRCACRELGGEPRRNRLRRQRLLRRIRPPRRILHCRRKLRSRHHYVRKLILCMY